MKEEKIKARNKLIKKERSKEGIKERDEQNKQTQGKHQQNTFKITIPKKQTTLMRQMQQRK